MRLREGKLHTCCCLYVCPFCVLSSLLGLCALPLRPPQDSAGHGTLGSFPDTQLSLAPAVRTTAWAALCGTRSVCCRHLPGANTVRSWGRLELELVLTRLALLEDAELI